MTELPVYLRTRAIYAVGARIRYTFAGARWVGTVVSSEETDYTIREDHGGRKRLRSPFTVVQPIARVAD